MIEHNPFNNSASATKAHRVFVASDVSQRQNSSQLLNAGGLQRAQEAVNRVLTQLGAASWPTNEPDSLLLDHGVRAVLDKLVAMKAGMFLAAPRECGGGHAFTNEIHETRLAQNLRSDSWEIVKE